MLCIQEKSEWLLRFELWGEVLFPETEVVPQLDNQERNTGKKNKPKNILKVLSWMFVRSKKEMKMKEGN